MKLIQLLSTLAVAGVLGGCAAGPQQGDAHAHSDHSSTGATEKPAMCAKHQAMMAGKSPGERHGMMQEHMKSMSPEMRQRMQGMQGMHEQCR